MTVGEKSSGEPRKNLLIGFCEEQSKASLIGEFALPQGVSRCRKAQIANFWIYIVQCMFSHLELPRTLGRSEALVTRMYSLKSESEYITYTLN